MSEKTTSQSIFVTLDTLKTSTSVPGANPQMQEHTLPRNQFPTAEQFSSEIELHKWAVENDILHAVLQKGVRAHLIDCRAKFKSCKKGDIWSNDYGQKNLNDYKWEIQTRPESAISDKDKAKQALANLSKEELAELLASMNK